MNRPATTCTDCGSTVDTRFDWRQARNGVWLLHVECDRCGAGHRVVHAVGVDELTDPRVRRAIRQMPIERLMGGPPLPRPKAKNSKANP
jgi:hypothetical protein